MRHLGEEIAVLDGIPDGYNAGPQFDPTAGANLTGGSSWDPRMPLTPSQSGLAGADEDLMGMLAEVDRAKGFHRAIPRSYNAGAVFDPTSGGNYKGGSSWDPRMPLTPPVSGLASVPDLDLAQVYTKNLHKLKAIPSEYNAGRQFDPTAGANYSGGSSWNPDMPLTPSQSGLAGTYNGHSLDSVDGRYGSTIDKLPDYYNVGNQFSVSAGANYSGGSDWNPNLPLTPSSSGLAELSAIVPMDRIKDSVFKAKLYGNQIPAFKRVASQARVQGLKKAAARSLRQGNVKQAAIYGRILGKIRRTRMGIMRAPVFGARRAAA